MEKQTEEIGHENKSAYSHVIKYTGLFGGIQGFIVLIGVLRTKAVALFLGPSGLALINIYNNIISLVNQATGLGISFSAVKDVAEHYGRGDMLAVRQSVNTVRVWSLLTAGLGTLFLLLLSPLVSWVTFGNYDYVIPCALLSPVIGMMAVCGGELAILKGLKQLKRVAAISFLGALTTLLLSVPLFICWGKSAIAPSLVLCNLVVMLVHLWASAKVAPWDRSVFRKLNVLRGVNVVKLGLAYVTAGVFSQGAEYIIRVSLLRLGDMDAVGLYNSGYMMAVTYASLIFTAVEADYFPRLSAAVKDLRKANEMVNQQVEVCVLLMAPILILYVLCMPVIVPLLFSREFLPCVPMVVVGVFYMFLKALTLPVAYLALANGKSKVFMAAELAYSFFVALAIPLAYRLGGLEGTGWALSAAGLFDFLLIYIAYRLKFGFMFDWRNLKLFIVQFLLLVTVVFVVQNYGLLTRCMVGVLLFAVSFGLSFRRLRRRM